MEEIEIKKRTMFGRLMYLLEADIPIIFEKEDIRTILDLLRMSAAWKQMAKTRKENSERVVELEDALNRVLNIAKEVLDE